MLRAIRMKFLNAIYRIVIFLLLTLTFAWSSAEARVTGDCEACHGLYPGMMEPPQPGKPAQFALRNELCVNCHTSTDAETTKVIGGAVVPAVMSGRASNRPLAGGNFYHLKRTGKDRLGHNVDTVFFPDMKYRNNPPGYERLSDPSSIGYNPAKPLTCAGSNGCHGNRNIEDPFEAILGSHHAEDQPIDGSTSAKSFRYLKQTDRIKGVLGIEDPLWEQIKSSKKHNEYSVTITQICMNCHGSYHGIEKTGKESPWLRHPTDISLPKTGEFALYNPDVPPPPDRPGIRIYSTDAPVARRSLLDQDRLGETVTPGSDTVTCISCHYAHAGPFESSLRWNYNELYAGEGGKGGCMICHTDKRK